jgi:transcriptional regulator with XRE-family HTH domain
MEPVFERIRAAREAAGLTRTDLAALVGVSESTVHRWESGERAPGGQKLLTLAAALKLDPKALRSDIDGGARALVTRDELDRLRENVEILTHIAKGNLRNVPLSEGEEEEVLARLVQLQKEEQGEG